MGFKATSRKIIQISYCDTMLVFTVRHMTTGERAAIKARQAEIDAITAAQAEGNTEALKNLGKNTDLQDLINLQTADMVLDIEEEKDGARTPALFDVGGEGADKTWKELSPADRIDQMAPESAGFLFSQVWGKMIVANRDVRILGK